MEINGKVHCFFEQSGTFKNEFIKLGYAAEDYDIQNNFGETDHVIDLFQEIETAYNNITRQDKTRQDKTRQDKTRQDKTIFDSIDPCQDLIIAFFPCIYFCENNDLFFRGEHMNLRNKSDVEKSKLIIERADNRNLFYKKILKLWAVCSGMNIRLIMENPYSTFHFLKNNFPCKPSVIDMNRMERGDYFVKPTQYWFVNCKPTYGYTYQNDKDKKTLNQISGNQVGGICNTERSMISPDYARNWICDFVIGKTQNIGQLQFDF